MTRKRYLVIKFLRATVRVAAAAVLMLGAVDQANAGFVLNFNNSYTSDSATPNGTGPWLTATFEDGVGSNLGKVLVTLQSKVSGGEYIALAGFNYSGPTGLAVSNTTGPSFSFGDSNSELSGGGAPTFDFGLQFVFGPPAGRFDNTDVITFVLSANSAITSDNFKVAKNGFYAGIRIRGIATGSGSGKYRGELPPPTDPPSEIPGVPEPGTLALLALGSIGLGGYRKLRIQKEMAA